MPVIYAPGGLAREYAPLAVNLFRGCGHGCLYCYAADMDLRNKKAASKAAWHGMVQVREGIYAELAAEAQARANRLSMWDPPWGPVLLCFMCDPYPPEAALCVVTAEAVRILAECGAAIKILSKGGLRSVQDLEVLAEQPKRHMLGATFTCIEPELAKVWEPGAATPDERWEALAKAKAAGVATWASLEPILYPALVRRMVDWLAPVVDHFALGTLNNKTRVPGLPAVAREGLGRGLPEMKNAVKAALEALGYREISDGSKAPADGRKTYYFKSGLQGIL